MTRDPRDLLALLGQAWAHTHRGNVPGVARLLEPLSRDELLEHAELACLLAESYRRAGQIARARELLQAVRGSDPGRGNDTVYRMLLNNEGLLDLHVGNLDGAERSWRELMQAAAEAGDHRRLGRACNNLSIVASVRRENPESLVLLARARAASHRAGDLVMVGSAHLNAAIVYQEMGRLDDAFTAAETAIGYIRHAHEGILGTAEATRAELYLALGDVRMADGIVRWMLEQKARSGLKSVFDDLEVARARVLLAQGATTEAVDILRAFVNDAVSRGIILTGAFALTELAVALAEMADEAGAGEAAARAARAFVEMGALARVQWVAERVSESGALAQATR